MAELDGRTAIITGGSRGIGLAIARAFVANGAQVLLVGRDRDSLGAAAGHLGSALIEVGDISASDTATAAVAQAMRAWGQLDILANVAGAFPTARLEDTSDGHYDEAIAANLTGTFRMCRAALPVMRAAGRGAIVNMSSTAARLPTPGLSVYGAAKAAVEAFTRAVAMEAAPYVRVNAVSAGPTLTDAVRALMVSDTTGAVAAVTGSLPLARMAEPAEIAEAFLFLASDRSSIVTGQVLHANSGGFMA